MRICGESMLSMFFFFFFLVLGQSRCRLSFFLIQFSSQQSTRESLKHLTSTWSCLERKQQGWLASGDGGVFAGPGFDLITLCVGFHMITYVNGRSVWELRFEIAHFQWLVYFLIIVNLVWTYDLEIEAERARTALPTVLIVPSWHVLPPILSMTTITFMWPGAEIKIAHFS